MSPYLSEIGFIWSILIGAFGIVTSCLLIFLKKGKSFSYYVSLAALLGMLIGPFYWTTATLADGVNGMIPQAGPKSAQSFAGVAEEVRCRITTAADLPDLAAKTAKQTVIKTTIMALASVQVQTAKQQRFFS
ncbi:hypothetical protein PO124_26440 [Bacillus licheniformis]|nr:hypothetical protein [Bacillus licheniformis]